MFLNSFFVETIWALVQKHKITQLTCTCHSILKMKTAQQPNKLISNCLFSIQIKMNLVHSIENFRFSCSFIFHLRKNLSNFLSKTLKGLTIHESNQLRPEGLSLLFLMWRNKSSIKSIVSHGTFSDVDIINRFRAKLT